MEQRYICQRRVGLGRTFISLSISLGETIFCHHQGLQEVEPSREGVSSPVNGDANQLSAPILAVSMLPAFGGLSPRTHGQREPDKHLASGMRVAQSRKMAEGSATRAKADRTN